jgi:hypothetical protein
MLVADDMKAAAIPPLQAMLRNESDDLKFQAAASLQGLGAPAREAIKDALHDSSAAVRKQAAYAAGSPKFASLVPDLLQLLKDEDADVRASAAAALGQVGSPALSAVRDLVGVADNNDEARGAVAKIAAALAKDERTDALSDLMEARTRLESKFIGSDDSSEKLRGAIAQLLSARNARWATWAAIALGNLALLSLIALGVPRIQRAVLVFIGRRWILALGECEFQARVIGAAEGTRISLRPGKEGLSAVLERVIPRDTSVLDEKVLDSFQSVLGKRAKVRVEVDKLLYGQPWARFIAGGWNSANGNIGGQIALATDLSFARAHYGRNLRFHALATARGDSRYGALPMARSEVQAARRTTHPRLRLHPRGRTAQGPGEGQWP